jgi:antirestriction protein ArdC
MVFHFYPDLRSSLPLTKPDISRSIARASWVFNAAQVDKWTPPEPKQLSDVQIDSGLKAFVEATEARIDHGYGMARYRVDLDRIEMPSPSWFFDTNTQTASEGYHSTLLHELTHWTGASHRIGRDLTKRFGTKAYPPSRLRS